MKRREFITLLGGAAAWPVVARAQQTGRIRRVGALIPYPENDQLVQSRMQVFVRGLQALGWTKGYNIQIDYRWAGDNPDDLRTYAVQLVGMKPDVILAVNPPAAAALKQETRTVPIVFTNVGSAVESGLVESLAKPGGNLTGFTNFESSLAAKWLDFLMQITPLSKFGIIQNPANPATKGYLRSLAPAAALFGVQLVTTPVHNAAEIERAIETIAQASGVALIVLPDPSTTTHRVLITGLATQHRWPAIYPFRYFAESGGLISYGPIGSEPFMQAAAYIDRILKGEKPADLPVQGPTKFELVINLKTAKILGLTIPLKLLAIADEVIE